MRRILLALSILFIATAFISGWFLNAAWWSQPEASAPLQVVIERGASFRTVTDLLASKGLVSSLAYRVFSRVDAEATRPKPGTYEIRKGTSYHDIARTLATGMQRDEVSVKLIEGKTLDDEASVLKNVGIAPEAFYALVGKPPNATSFDRSLAAEYPFLALIPAGMTLEGYAFPDTYRVWKDQLPDGLLRKQLDELQTDIIEPYAEQQKASGMTWHQLITLASIVEAEVQTPEDRKVVAGIFYNRLNNSMRLQSDATVNYVTRAGRTRPTSQDLETDSPYNTYRNDGLPPGPVSNPSRSSLLAVLEPTKSAYYFFLTDEQGKVYYAKTYDEHLLNKQRVYGR